MAALGNLLMSLTQILPLKVVIGLAAAIVVIGAPFWFESVRDRQIRGAVRRMVRADPASRAALAERAVGLAGDKPHRLRVVVDSAIKYDQRALRDQALDQLDAAGAGAEAARIRRTLRPEPPKLRDPLEAAVRIEQLLASGAIDGARELLDTARRAFPDDPELAAIERRERDGVSPSA
ncbi:MAG: hypothetical protein ABMA64_05065 [Myxococcota bacterium]